MFWQVYVTSLYVATKVAILMVIVSVHCDGVGCRVLCLRHGISVWQHIGQSTTATSRHLRDMTLDVSKRR